MPKTPQYRLRTQLILVATLISCALSAASLLIVRASVEKEIGSQMRTATSVSVQAFARFRREQDVDLQRTAALLSELPPLKALMTAHDRLTVQDASTEFWDLSGSDLLVLTNPEGKVFGVHSTGLNLSNDGIQQMLSGPIEEGAQLYWWQSKEVLFRVALRPITAGSAPGERLLGELVLGQRLDSTVAEQIREVSGGEISLVSANTVVASTLPPAGRAELEALLTRSEFSGVPQRHSIQGRAYEITSLAMETGAPVPIRCVILHPLDPAERFLDKLNWMIAVLGVVIGLVGAAIMTLISRAMTKPLEKLAQAVKAMASGNDTYTLPAGGTIEVRQLTDAFDRMRSQVAESQKKQLEAERLAALGRAAGSISHDLRHILAALVANAEFLRDAEEIGCDRQEVYEELQRASGEMIGLIDSLVEIAREGQQLRRTCAWFSELVEHAVASVQSNPEFRGRKITISVEGEMQGMFDVIRLERAIVNLLLNACQATDPIWGTIDLRITADAEMVECWIADNGPGIPGEICKKLFQPFVSSGKPNGTGLGLAIAAKVIQEHEGQLTLVRTSSQGTLFHIRLPRGEEAASSPNIESATMSVAARSAAK